MWNAYAAAKAAERCGSPARTSTAPPKASVSLLRPYAIEDIDVYFRFTPELVVIRDTYGVRALHEAVRTFQMVRDFGPEVRAGDLRVEIDGPGELESLLDTYPGLIVTTVAFADPLPTDRTTTVSWSVALQSSKAALNFSGWASANPAQRLALRVRFDIEARPFVWRFDHLPDELLIQRPEAGTPLLLDASGYGQALFTEMRPLLYYGIAWR